MAMRFPIPGPSVKALVSSGLTAEQAAEVKAHMRAGRPYEALNAYNAAADLFGVEFMRERFDDNPMRGDHGVEYANTGDSYDVTLMFDRKRGRFVLGSLAYLAERFPRRFCY